MAWCAISLATRATREIGEPPRRPELALLRDLAAGVDAAGRFVGARPRAPAVATLGARFDDDGPRALDAAGASRPRAVAFRERDLAPARVFFALLREREDFFVRAAMTVSSREWSTPRWDSKNWTHQRVRVHHTARYASDRHSSAPTR